MTRTKKMPVENDKTCPVCKERYEKTSFTTEDYINFKIFIHGNSKCKIPFGNISNQRYVSKEGVISSSVDSDLIEGVFSRYCKAVKIVDTKDHDFHFPESDVAVKRYSVDEFYSGMMKKVDGVPEVVFKAREMKKRFSKVCVLVSGLPSLYASEVLEIVSTDINLKIRQIVGFMASLERNGDADHCSYFESDAQLVYWAIKYASVQNK